jgi:D-glycero-D-manno-heptose 1,7-bisphosphate phosphatase
LDRDGTVIVDKVHLTQAENVELLPGAAEAVRRLNEAGLFTVIVSNQSVIARGMTTAEKVDGAMARMQELLKEHDAHIDAFYYCAGRAAGMPSIMIRGSSWDGVPAEVFLEKHDLTPDVTVDSLGEAADWIVKDITN